MTDAKQIEPLESRRLFAAGDLDPMFGTGGVVNVADSVTSAEVEVLPDGRIITAESKWSDVGEPDLIVLRRLMPDGTPDGSFGTGSSVTFTGLNGIDDVTELAPAGGGKLLVAGRSGVMRLNANGSMDTSFAGPARGHDDAQAGIAPLPGTPNGLNVAADGRIGIVGQSSGFAFATVLTPDGAFDERFDEGGSIHWGESFHNLGVTVGFDGNAAAFLSDSTLVYGGSRSETNILPGSFWRERRWVLGGFDRTGASRDAQGERLPGARESVDDIESLPNGSLLVATIGAESNSVSLARFDYTDPANPVALVANATFGAGGTADVVVAENVVRFGHADIEVLPDGRFYVLVQETGAGAGVALHLSRFLPDGSRDPSFPERVTAVPYDGAPVSQGELSLNGDDAVVLSRVDLPDANGTTLALRRFEGDGARLTRNGTLLISGTSGDDVINITRRARDGRILVEINGDGRLFLPQLVKRIQLYAHGGDDVVTIGPAVRSAFLHGGDGDDTLSGGDGDDLLVGGDGNDALTGALGNDSLEGGVGNDELHGNAGNDYLLGSAGHDVMHGHGGRDQLIGAGGNDRLFGGPGSADDVSGGPGFDQAANDPLDAYAGVEQLLA